MSLPDTTNIDRLPLFLMAVAYSHELVSGRFSFRATLRADIGPSVTAYFISYASAAPPPLA